MAGPWSWEMNRWSKRYPRPMGTPTSWSMEPLEPVMMSGYLLVLDNASTSGYPDIVVYGAPGTGYDVLFSPNAVTGGLWQPIWLGTMPSNMQMPVSGLTNSEPTMFFRARTHAN